MVDQCTSKFISWITEKANQRCQSESRTKLGADDLLWALKTVGYHDYFRPLDFYLKRYRYSNEIESMQLFGENPKSTSSAFEISHPSPPPPNPLFELVEAMKMDEFWAELDNKSSGSTDNASTTIDPST
ncbi:hypothetical protein TSUD_129130 [Trifolium subterraneum]|uniref:Transcription factor CBF/NF-Y/archaeal histone domain-containing protein n=1 Tax=Trifolium subterraneum TaxID=3900 RepID=A0A2Z6PGA7_TRISU|nr:hypothetical protein TSUD_129130 [Trifolium subterraneum]